MNKLACHFGMAFVAGLCQVLLLASCAYGDITAQTVQSETKPPPPRTTEVRNELFSEYIEMPDGVLLAADIFLPSQKSHAEPVPSIIQFTRYWRAIEVSPPQSETHPWVQAVLAAGYAYIVVDVRGTGASQGVRKAELSLTEARDMPHVIDWVARQAWSNGRVATFGESYAGNTAEMAALFPHPALVAAVPRFTDFDWFTSIVLPGGLKNRFIAEQWGARVRQLDMNDPTVFGEHDGVPSQENPKVLGVRPVDSDTDRSILNAAVRDHRMNTSLASQLKTLSFRDEYPVAADLSDSGDRAVSIHRFKNAFEEAELPMYQWGSWFDAGTAAGILARFAHWDAPYRYVIGAWNHGGNHDADPYAERDASPRPSLQEQIAAIFEFLDPLMKSETKQGAVKRELRYFTIGENSWKTTRTWPPEGQVRSRWYFQPGNTLTKVKPVETQGFDKYSVDFEAGTGPTSRWSTQLGGGEVYYGDRSEADRKLLTYTSAPLDEDMEITGVPVVSLEVSSTHEDGAFIVYLEDVAPDGHVRMLSEGHLRAIHRALIDPERQVFTKPLHTFQRNDSRPMVPGQVTTIRFKLLPVSVLLRKGHAIRIAIAGHDKDTFVRTPNVGNPVIQIHRQAGNVSWVELPIVRR